VGVSKFGLVSCEYVKMDCMFFKKKSKKTIKTIKTTEGGQFYINPSPDDVMVYLETDKPGVKDAYFKCPFCNFIHCIKVSWLNNYWNSDKPAIFYMDCSCSKLKRNKKLDTIKPTIYPSINNDVSDKLCHTAITGGRIMLYYNSTIDSLLRSDVFYPMIPYKDWGAFKALFEIK
jgi:hypothetical protein